MAEKKEKAAAKPKLTENQRRKVSRAEREIRRTAASDLMKQAEEKAAGLINGTIDLPKAYADQVKEFEKNLLKK